ncbi:putative glyoxalase bleomycin resistance dioxygenase superfamily protein [Phaeoacremonium minimum UCRPA7]|uniref:Putative glyoxalase bleomycin resistance dioxygenase superfamily protein n=1 Tax=Phaeoacremonium minimum (strain UCR-PA7) TaxID=1286976 RepID=R8BY35_PHAM7|nr:putative glyoxalase bleomycin resistance dioxygenase superfamily protein [Phaeoacremonium minimum UCRPA7]EOO04240.1 putative glyoxalase bleomycin resistance dioxygenase superfamily protein [Phaeoacremonium minimum UCRPA7]
MGPLVFNHPVNHIAISIPDLQAAEEWYMRVLGFSRLRPSKTLDRATEPHAAIFKIYPTSLQRVQVAYLSSGNGVGVELFEFQEPRIRQGSESNFERDISRGGLFHMAITTPDVVAMCDHVVTSGGKMIGQAVTVFGQDAVYAQDPWGNVVELLSCSFDQLMSNR